MKQEKTNTTPEKAFSDGALSIAIWNNTKEATTDEPARTFHTITHERRYKNKDDEWKYTAQLRRRDLLPMTRLLQKAYDYILSVEKPDISDEEETPPEIQDPEIPLE